MTSSDRLVLGTAKLGIDGEDIAFELLDEYARLGGRVIDTASVYSDWLPHGHGRSEATIGAWLKSRGVSGGFTIATKGAHPPLGDMSQSRCDPASIRADVELSLKRLEVERIDLWHLHRDDPARPAAEIVGTLQALVREGKIAQFGGSNWTLDRVEQAMAVPGQSFAAVQNLGNVFCRLMNPLRDDTCVVLDAPLVRYAAQNRLRIECYTSSAHGYFERRAKGVAPTGDYANAVCERAATELEALAAELGIAPGNMIVAYLLHLPGNVRVLLGPRNAGQLRDMWPAAQLVLPPEIVARIATIAGMSDFFA